MMKPHYLRHFQRHLVDTILLKIPKEAKFRRDLVLKNLNQNGFINKEQYLELKKKN